MLAHPTKSLSEVLNRFEGMEFTCEYKYDGERAQVYQILIQIHLLDNGKGMIYSRNSENLSEKYPDVIERMPNVIVFFMLELWRWNENLCFGLRSGCMGCKESMYPSFSSIKHAKAKGCQD